MFLISEDDANKLATILLEIPAKLSLNGIDILRNLKPIPTLPKEKQLPQNEDKKDNE